MTETMRPSDETIAVRVNAVSKHYLLAEKGKRNVSLWTALRTGDPDVQQRRIEALSDVSFEVPSGQRLGIIGRNGAGKTTLLSILAGVSQPTTGSVEINGDVHAILTIGAVLREEVSGRDNIRLDGAVHGKSSNEIAAYEEEVITFSELGEFIDRPVRTYSSGMKARLAFSMGAFVKPDVLIIDETLSVGDAFFSTKATKRIKEVAASGRVVIMVSHGLAAITEMCERCLWMDNGRIIMDGPPHEVTKAYERAVEQADEQELARKFGRTNQIGKRSDKGELTGVTLHQYGKPIVGSAHAMVPVRLAIAGHLQHATAPDIALTITRVDGREIASTIASHNGVALDHDGSINVMIDFDPMILGADLYLFQIQLIDGETILDTANLVCEMVDEEGQYGGVPLLLDPPSIAVHPIEEDPL